jgi:cbb3-type cytochrome oxidase maturation protein
MAWIVLTAIGIAASILVFIWAIKSGQFSDQGRARYLPLCDESPDDVCQRTSAFRFEALALILVVVVVLSAMVGAVYMTIVSVYG